MDSGYSDVQVIEHASLKDVKPGDYLVWTYEQIRGSVKFMERREGVVHRKDEHGDWWSKDGYCVAEGDGLYNTITIYRDGPSLPTKIGTTIVANDGYESIEAEVDGITLRARKATLKQNGCWRAVWRPGPATGCAVHSRDITTNTWKVDTK